MKLQPTAQQLPFIGSLCTMYIYTQCLRTRTSLCTAASVWNKCVL